MQTAHRCRTLRSTVFIIPLLALLVIVSMVQGGTTKVVITGDPAPGAPEGAVFTQFSNPLLDDTGQIVFLGSMQPDVGGVDFSNNHGIWRGDTLIAREGFHAPGTPAGAVFGNPLNIVPGFDNTTPFSALSVNNSGQVAFRGDLLPGLGGVEDFFTDHGIWRDNTLVARVGSQAPGTPEGTVFGGFQFVLNNAGQVAFRGDLRTGGGVTSSNNSGIWRDNTLVFREGTQAPDAPAGALLRTFNDFTVGDTGQVAFQAAIAGGVVNPGIHGLWQGDTLLFTEGSQAPGVEDGTVFNGTFFDLTLNNTGQLAYTAEISNGPGGTSGPNTGIWRNNTLVAREGTQAPGTPEGALFGHFGGSLRNPVLNNAGQVAFFNTLKAGIGNPGGVDTSNQQGIWFENTLIAREGSQAPGTPEGAVFNQFTHAPVLNDTGQVAYMANLRLGEGGVDFTNALGIWLHGSNGDAMLVARTGDQIDGRTFESLGNVGLVLNNMPISLNNSGQVAFRALLDGGLDEALYLFTPDVRWIGTDSGSWDDTGTDSGWTLGLLPGAVHDVDISPDTNLTITAPTGSTTVKSLTLDGGAGEATLRFELDSSDVGASDRRISALEALSLDGKLDLILAAGFTPDYGDTFDILGYATRDGVFQQVAGHFISPVLALGQFYDDTNGVLQLLATAPGDANGDLIVTIDDFGLLAGNFNQPGTWETGDFNGDGITNINDFGLLAANFNGDFNTLMAAATELGITTIPEPGTATLIGLVVLGVTTKRLKTDY